MYGTGGLFVRCGSALVLVLLLILVLVLLCIAVLTGVLVLVSLLTEAPEKEIVETYESVCAKKVKA